jgi:hypothetical protein
MNDELSPEEIEGRRRRDVRRIVWVLLPITIVFSLLLLVERFWLLQK